MKTKKADRFQRVVQGREPSFQSCQTSARPMDYLRRSHHCFFLSHRFCQAVTYRLTGATTSTGYQIQRPGESIARRPIAQHQNASSSGSPRTQLHEPPRRPLSHCGDPAGSAPWPLEGAIQRAAAGIFVTAAPKPLCDRGHVYPAFAAQAEAYTVVSSSRRKTATSIPAMPMA